MLIERRYFAPQRWSLSVIFLLLAVPVMAQPLLPDMTLTPGDTDPHAVEVNAKTGKLNICTPNYTKGKQDTVKGGKVRNVTPEMEREVFRLYGITFPAPHGEYEVDHLISLELGGANNVKNLWPQSYKTMPVNAHKKDRLENYFHKLVCKEPTPETQKRALGVFQREITSDWIAAYKRHFGTPPDDKKALPDEEIDIEHPPATE